ncbi:MAG TPA: hypothetical protein VHB21_10005, partial [Minicystis sp.]|nr:hypothetical protein [Minicystis sp.]
ADDAWSAEPVTAPPEAGGSWWPALERAAGAAARLERLHVCVIEPAPPKKDEAEPSIASLRALLPSALSAVPEARRAVREGDAWSVRLSLSACDDAADAGVGASDAGAGAPDAGGDAEAPAAIGSSAPAIDAGPAPAPPSAP